jgi:hypothetical protein
MAMVPSFNQFGCGHDNASISNVKVWKSKDDPSNLLQKEKKKKQKINREEK